MCEKEREEGIEYLIPLFAGGCNVLPRWSADRGGHVQQRGGRARLQRVPGPHWSEGSTQGL